MNRIPHVVASASAVAASALLMVSGVQAQDKTIKIYGLGARTGPISIFGLQSEGAMRAAADVINKSGGITLGDGSKAKLLIEYIDDRCVPEDAINGLRRIASQPDAIVAIGTSCSNTTEPVFGVLQKKVGDTSDSGIQFPIYGDVAAKGGLASISQWAFRNVPSETAMYKSVFEWLKTTRPELKTIYGGAEKDFAHSSSTFNIMKTQAANAGMQVLGQSDWLLNDINFSTQVREIKRANPDVVAISGHPYTTCGVLKEMARQHVTPKLLIGLTSSSSMETLHGCGAQAEGMIIPTSFAPVTPEAKRAAEAMRAVNLNMDLHNAAAWENVFTLKEVFERQKVMGRPDTVQADRLKVRDGLASLKETTGLLGKVGRTADREAVKPYLFVQAKNGNWEVVYTPPQ